MKKGEGAIDTGIEGGGTPPLFGLIRVDVKEKH